ncbi:MAG TPA: 2-hydroxychromene-2-carboxylate isomerase [Casimicrobiaceae bacterium]|nr:2-hydroxychromene-2-carboxylate isomerase [Casimicrobiaceae bacterium]
MSAAIEFWFDFSSPYGYLGSQKIEALAARHGRAVDWHPMLLGVAFKQSGMAPLTEIPLKGDYARRDIPRSARFHDVQFRMPAKFPIPTQVPARIVLWTKDRDPVLAVKVIKALYRAYFVDGLDISNPDIAADVAATTGVDRAEARAAVDDPGMKEALRREVDGAIARGVFGSPFVFIDGEPFWGLDRFDQIDRWLASGGF